MFHSDKDQNKLVGQDQKLPRGAAIPIPEAPKSTLDPLLISRGDWSSRSRCLFKRITAAKWQHPTFHLVDLLCCTQTLGGWGGSTEAGAAAVIYSHSCCFMRKLLQENIKNACTVTSEGKIKLEHSERTATRSCCCCCCLAKPCEVQ